MLALPKLNDSQAAMSHRRCNPRLIHNCTDYIAGLATDKETERAFKAYSMAAPRSSGSACIY